MNAEMNTQETAKRKRYVQDLSIYVLQARI